MARASSGQHGARRRALTAATSERQVQASDPAVRRPTASQVEDADRRRAARACGWCGQQLEPKARGRIPKWCSAACRQRAWEQARAADSGLSAVRVVERTVEVRVPANPTRRDWARLLHELAHQLDDGRVYNRDLPDLAAALHVVEAAYSRRPFVRDRAAAGKPL